MSRKKEIADNLWHLVRKVYQIGSEVPTSDKQVQLIELMSDYVDQNFTRRKKEKECSTSNQS